MQGLFLDSVERSEITVTVGDQLCKQIASNEDDIVRDLYAICIPSHNMTGFISFSTYAYLKIILQTE